MRFAALLLFLAPACVTLPDHPSTCTCPDMSTVSADLANVTSTPDLATAEQSPLAGISTRKLIAAHDYDLDVAGVESSQLVRAAWTFGDCQPYVKVLDVVPTGATQLRLLVSIGAVPAPLTCAVEAAVAGQVIVSLPGALQISVM